MFGRKVLFAGGEMGRLERTVLAAEGLRRASFISHVKGLHLDGGRRPLRVPVIDTEVRWDAAERALLLRFTLPPGAFATTLLEQVMGPGRAAALARPEEDEIESGPPE
jgi:tRNA pseudouridine13 synthase